MDLNQVKFLAGAYYCQLQDVDFQKVTPKLLNDSGLNNTENSLEDSSENIVLLQMVSLQ